MLVNVQFVRVTSLPQLLPEMRYVAMKPNMAIENNCYVNWNSLAGRCHARKTA